MRAVKVKGDISNGPMTTDSRCGTANVSLLIKNRLFKYAGVYNSNEIDVRLSSELQRFELHYPECAFNFQLFDNDDDCEGTLDAYCAYACEETTRIIPGNLRIKNVWDSWNYQSNLRQIIFAHRLFVNYVMIAFHTTLTKR